MGSGRPRPSVSDVICFHEWIVDETRMSIIKTCLKCGKQKTNKKAWWEPGGRSPL